MQVKVIQNSSKSKASEFSEVHTIQNVHSHSRQRENNEYFLAEAIQAINVSNHFEWNLWQMEDVEEIQKGGKM